MSSVSVITFIIILLAALVCYAFIAQTLVQKRQRRERVMANLKTRARNFKYMLQTTPSGYLPKELKLLVQRSLSTIYEQLMSLERADPSHKDELQQLNQQIAETQRQNDLKQRQSIENPLQAKEVKQCLEELYKFVFNLEAKHALNRPQADAYRSMIKLLVLELTADSYVLQGRIAKDKEKWRLAVHYFDLGLKLLLREGRNGQFDGRIAQLRKSLSEMEAKVMEEDQMHIPIAPHEELDDSAWEELGPDESWKKKQIYD